MDKTERFYQIERLLNERKVVPRRVFLEELEISAATFKRDLEYMRDRFNAPIVWDSELRGYRFDKDLTGPRFELPGMWFNASEVYALLTMQQLLKDIEPGLLSQHIAPLLTRLRAILDEGDVPTEDIDKRIRFLRQAARQHDTRHFTPIAAAVLQRRRVVIDHYVRARDATIERQVSPLRLTFYREAWYVDGWCHLRNGLRSFALDAIKQVSVTTEPAMEVADDQIKLELDGGYGIFSGGNVQWAELTFSPTQARWVSREVWHPQQEGSMNADGSYSLKVPFSDPTELSMDIMRHMPAVRVLAPESLRERIVRQLEAGLKYVKEGSSNELVPE
jgi:predicted DNA-binding transcriptional regulator YafY